MLPFALVLSAAAGLAVGWELRRTVRTLSPQPVGSRTARAPATGQGRAQPSARAVAAAAAALSRDDFTGFLEALEVAMPAELGSLWDTLNARPESEPKRYLTAFMDRCAEIAPELGLKFLDQQVCDQKERGRSRIAYFVIWAGYHPSEAIRAAAASPEGPNHTLLLRTLATATAKDHPEIFFQEREALRGPGSTDPVDPFRGESVPEAARIASNYDDALSDAAAALARLDPALAVRTWTVMDKAMDRDLRFAAGVGLARGWAERDPTAAEAWVRTWQDSDDRASGLLRIANAVAKTDPARAGALLMETHSYENNPKGPNYSKLRAYWHQDDGPSAVEVILQQLLRDDPVGAQDWAGRYIPVQADYQVGRLLAGALPSDIDAALDRLTQLDAPALVEAVGPVAWNWRPRGVLERLEELVQRFPEDRREAGRALLLASAVGRDPENVIAAAAVLPEGETRETVLKEAFGQWLNRCPSEATAWLGAAPSGPERDRIIYRATAQLAELDPANAWAWLMTTAEGSERNNQLFEVAEEWGQRDAEAARAAIEALSTDAELKADMLKNALRTYGSQETEAPGPAEDAFR